MNSNKQNKLGRGLSALLGNSINFTNDSKIKKIESEISSKQKESGIVVDIELQNIIAGKFQPRNRFEASHLQDLANSIKENGILQPITVRTSKNNKFEIIAGERRFRAAKIANLKKIPAIIKEVDDVLALELAMIENIQRDDLLPAEEARGYKRLMTDFSYTQDQVAKKTGKSRSHVANLLRLLTLPAKVLDLIDGQKLSMGHARALVGHQECEKLANLIVSQGLNVRQIEEIVADDKRNSNNSSLTKSSSRQKSRKSSIKNPPENNPAEILQKIKERLQNTVGIDAKLNFDQSKKAGSLTIKFSNPKQLEKIFF